MDVTHYMLWRGATYLWSVLSEEEAKKEVAALVEKNPDLYNVGIRFHYSKHTRRSYTEYEELTGLPEWSRQK